MTEAILPESLQLIADIVGAPAALKIAARWGGTRLYITEAPGEDHPLAQLIGLDAARALGEAYAGERIEIAKADCWKKAMRNRLILDARKSGVSQARLAREHDITERHVRNIETGVEEDINQGHLF